jgi:NAD(P)-dependent dehydrogenase (short-subunit alcohol dehydrogenase family)
MPNTDRPVAIITGTSRDVGEYTAYGLAQAGWNIAGSYRNEQHDEDQAAVIRRVKRYKVGMVAPRVDITDKNAPVILDEVLKEHFGGQLKALVLNAAGGYGKSFQEAEAINVRAQLRLVNHFRDKLAQGGVIVFNNSDPGHRFELLRSTGFNFGDYEFVAQSKHAMEQLLRSQIEEFAAVGIRVGFTIGNALDGSFIGRVMAHKRKDLIKEWLRITPDGFFPTAMDMSAGVVKVVRGNFPSGYTEYVGISEAHQLYPASSFR